ncbi:hypothetical protein DMENIID0001_043600 [Sergentomyia squamirostris]
MQNFNLYEQEELISAVRRHPAIWNKKSKEFRLLPVNDRAYKTISAIFGKSPEATKGAWETLVSKYKREKQNRISAKPRSGAAGGKKYNVNTWALYPLMVFLDDVQRPRKVQESHPLLELNNSEAETIEYSDTVDEVEVQSHQQSDADDFTEDLQTPSLSIPSFLPALMSQATQWTPENSFTESTAKDPVASFSLSLSLSRKRKAQQREMAEERKKFVQNISDTIHFAANKPKIQESAAHKTKLPIPLPTILKLVSNHGALKGVSWLFK